MGFPPGWEQLKSVAVRVIRITTMMRLFNKLPEEKKQFLKKQKMAYPSRYYGNGGTVHGSNLLNIEVYQGQVVSVWFRCQMLPFNIREVERDRAIAMTDVFSSIAETTLLTGVEVYDQGEQW